MPSLARAFFHSLLFAAGGCALGQPLHRDCSSEKAFTFKDRGEYRQSERAFRDVLACQERSLPADDLHIAATLSNLGEVKRLQHQLKPAEALLKQAVRRHEMAGRMSHTALGIALLSLASTYKDWKQYSLAEPLARRSLEIFDSSSGPDSREAAAAWNTLAVLQAESGNMEGAVRTLQTALARREHSPPDVTTANVQYNLGKILLETGRVREAEEWLRKALEFRVQLLGYLHPETRLTLRTYESLLKQTGRKAEARHVRSLYALAQSPM